MGFWGDVGDVLGSIGRGAIQAAPAALNYLAAREQGKAVREVAKAKSGAAGPVQAQKRIQQSGLVLGPGWMSGSRGLSFGPSAPQNGGNVLAQLGLPGYGGGQVAQQSGVVFDATTAVAPYIADKLGAYLFGGGGATNGGNGRMNGNGAMVPYTGGHICRRQSGTMIANDLYDFYTEAGNPRGTVASVADGRITYWTNRGTPVLFSRDATICKRIRSKSSKMAHAAGHRHSVTRRKR